MTGTGAPFIGQILDAAFQKAQAVLVLLTGDDEARLREHYQKGDEPGFESKLMPQARPNVLFEAGMAFGRHPDRTILVQLGSLRQFSDVAGRHIIQLDDSTERRQDVAERLAAVGCPVDLSGRDWHKAGSFGAAIQCSSQPTLPAPDPGDKSANPITPQRSRLARDIATLIEHAHRHFEDILGAKSVTLDSGHTTFTTSFAIIGCGPGTIWQYPTGEWAYRCDLVRKHKERKVVTRVFDEKVPLINEGCASDWKVSITRADDKTLPSFIATSPCGAYELWAFIHQDNEDNSCYADLKCTMKPWCVR